MQAVDESFTKGLSRFLFKGDAPFGLDLAAININRGRDWALRSYNDYLTVIGFKKVEDFSLYGPEVRFLVIFFVFFLKFTEFLDWISFSKRIQTS